MTLAVTPKINTFWNLVEGGASLDLQPPAVEKVQFFFSFNSNVNNFYNVFLFFLKAPSPRIQCENLSFHLNKVSKPVEKKLCYKLKKL